MKSITTVILIFCLNLEEMHTPTKLHVEAQSAGGGGT